ncbi:MAG: hypothetical protein L3K17_07825, partial [Thermoplasmata archaeon]|nr:hypothetical protein [Thermoplasmata archaeon]
RKHRWVRGDWQILRWLLGRVPNDAGQLVQNPTSNISRWKIFDNLRRSLVEPATFLLLVAGWLWLPGTARYWTLATLLIVIIPVLSALSVIPLFLLFRRLIPQNTIALVGAGLAGVFMPRIFSIAHPAPLALGDLFVMASLWMLVEGRRDIRWYLPLTLTATALIVTHHLSSYFFLVSAVGGLVLLELWRPGSWSVRFPVRELLFFAAFSATLLAYWFVYAPSFLGVLDTGLPFVHQGAVAAAIVGALLVVALLGGLLRWRRAHAGTTRLKFRYPTERSVVRDMVLVLVAELVGVLVLTAVPLPGTTQTTILAAVVFFSPIFAAIVFACGSRRLVTSSRLGPFGVTWLAAVGISALVALAANNPELPAARQPEYLLIPMGLLIAVGLGHVVGRWVTPFGRPGLVAAGLGVALLLGANAAIAYPPPSDFGGFQEGLTQQDAALWLWVGTGIPAWATVASDHRLSSMIFGFDGNPATWDSTAALFTGSNWTAASGELGGSNAPHTVRPVNVVAVDAVMHQGVALDPSALAPPLSSAALTWLSGPPFVPVYENGPQVVYWVLTPSPTAP